MPLSDLLLFLALLLSANLSGQVRTPDGTPVPGVRVVLREGRQILATAVTDERGRYRLSGLAPGTRSGAVIAGSSAFPFKLRIVPGVHPFDITVSLARWSLVHGRVLSPEGERVSGAEIQLNWETKKISDKKGGFYFLAPAGRYQILARKEGYAAARQGIELTAGSLADCELRLGRGASLHGRILGLPDEDLARATVQIARDLEPALGAFVEEDGTYRMTGLPPGKVWVRGWSHGKHAEAEVVLAEGQESEVDLDFPYREVDGRALDDEGRPVADRDLVFRSERDSATAHTSAAGRFEVDLRAGSYWVTAEGGEERLAGPELLTVGKEGRAGGKDLEVRLVAAASSLSGRLDGFDPAATYANRVEVTQTGLTFSAFADAQGRYELGGLLPGEWEVLATIRGVAVKGKVQVPLRGTARADFALPFDPARPRALDYKP